MKAIVDPIHVIAVIVDGDGQQKYYLWPEQTGAEPQDATGFHMGMAMQCLDGPSAMGHVIEFDAGDYPFTKLYEYLERCDDLRDAKTLMAMILNPETDDKIRGRMIMTLEEGFTDNPVEYQDMVKFHQAHCDQQTPIEPVDQKTRIPAHLLPEGSKVRALIELWPGATVLV